MSPEYFYCSTWHEIQDVIGPRSEWPSYLPILLWKAPVSYSWRLKIVSFFYGNGLNIEVLIDFLKQFRRRSLTPEKESKIRGLVKYWEDKDNGYERRNKVYYYDLTVRKRLNLNGNVFQQHYRPRYY